MKCWIYLGEKNVKGPETAGHLSIPKSIPKFIPCSSDTPKHICSQCARRVPRHFFPGLLQPRPFLIKVKTTKRCRRNKTYGWLPFAGLVLILKSRNGGLSNQKGIPKPSLMRPYQLSSLYLRDGAHLCYIHVPISQTYCSSKTRKEHRT